MKRRYRGYPMTSSEVLRGQSATQEQNVVPEQSVIQGQSAMPEQSVMQGQNTETQERKVWDERRRRQSEFDYARGLYPLSVRRWQRFVEEEFDRLDGPESAIYDAYPDREWLYLRRNQILEEAGEQDDIENEDVVLLLVLSELLRRRMVRGM